MTKQTNSKIPILTYSTGAGWTTHGFASSEESARRFIEKNLLSDSSKSLIKNYGFSLSVWKRTDLNIELNGGPQGFTYCVGRTVKDHRSHHRDKRNR